MRMATDVMRQTCLDLNVIGTKGAQRRKRGELPNFNFRPDGDEVATPVQVSAVFPDNLLRIQGRHYENVVRVLLQEGLGG